MEKVLPTVPARSLSDQVWVRLKTVMDPETNISVVDMGLIYEVTPFIADGREKIHISYTLTTPGCPLAGVFQGLIQGSLRNLAPDFDPAQDVVAELTFDPPWSVTMMSEEGRAELGL